MQTVLQTTGYTHYSTRTLCLCVSRTGRSLAGLVCESDEDMEELLARLDVEGFRLARDWPAEGEAERVFEDLFRSLSALLKSPLTRSAAALADALLLNLARLDVHLARITSTYLLGARISN